MSFLRSERSVVRSVVSAFDAVGLAQDQFHVLPVVPRAWLFDAFSRHCLEDRDLVLRHKIVPICWIPTIELYGVVTETAFHTAQDLGLKVAARINPEDYRAAVRRSFSPALLAQATHGLARHSPQFSAKQRLTPEQIASGFVLFSVLLVLSLLLRSEVLSTVLTVFFGLFFALVIGIRILALLPDVDAPARPMFKLVEQDLPIYSVLVPLFQETNVLPQLLQALLALNYPPEKLDIKLILEECDTPMQRALQKIALPPQFELIVVPAGKPQTKPRALNYALQFARGSLLTIYDSEDIPQPCQLRRAAGRFAATDDNVACLQASLCFYNPNENWLTRQFTAEYASLFKVLLPALANMQLPLLLGGTSNHFRVEALHAVGGWDPYNVTEDADLGIRLARYGFRTDVVESLTYEEATVTFGNWLKQRRRWMKGFLQTWLVHNRQPLHLLRAIGLPAFLAIQCTTIGIFASALFHPILLCLTIWHLTPQQVSLASQSHLSAFIAGAGISLLLAGYGASIWTAKRGLAKLGITGWQGTLCSMPLYWMLMSVAAWMALWDFIVKPFYWHKTKHGLSRFQSPIQK